MAALQDNDFLESVDDIESNIMVIEKPDESTDSQSEQFEVDLSGQEFAGTGFSKSTEKCVKFAVSLLKTWCTSNGESADIENMTFAELNEVLGKFYSNVRTKTGEYYSYSSLTSFRYSLNRYFQSMAEGKRFDIIENQEFFNSNEIFSTVVKSLKLKSTDKGEKNKLFLTSDELRQIYLQVFAEDSPKTLQYKVWFEVAVYFNKGGRSKQRVLTKNSFIFGNDAFGKFVFLKKDMGSESSMNSNKDGRKMYEKRNHPLCPVLSLAKYLSKLHPETMDLFQRPKYKISKSANVWYYHQPVGKNFLGNVMYLICTQAGISKQVSNKCLKNITPEVLDACVFSMPLNKLGVPRSVGGPAIMELKKRTCTKQSSSTVSQMDRFAAGDSSSQCSDIYESHGPKITYEEAKQEIQNLFQKFTPKVLGDVMLWLKNVDFSKDITGELICEDNSHFVTSQVQYNNSILSRGFQPNSYHLPPSQLPLSLNYPLPRYPLTPIPLKTVGPYNNMPQPSSVPRPFNPPAQNFVYNYSNRGLCSSLSTPVSSILPPSSLHHNPAQIGMRIPHDVNINNHNYNMSGNSSVEQLSPQNIPQPVVSHGRVLSPTYISSPFNYNNSTLMNLNNNPNSNETVLDTGTKHTWSTIPANLQTNQTGDGNTWTGNDVIHGKVKKASKQKRRKRRRRHLSEIIDIHRQTYQRELPVVFPWLETKGNPYEYMYFIQGREQIQGHMNTFISNVNNQGHMNTLISNANDQSHLNTLISNANDQGRMNTLTRNANDQGHMNTLVNTYDQGHTNDQGRMNTLVNANDQGHLNTLISNANDQGHMNTFVNSNDTEHVNMFVTNVSRQVDDSRILVNNVTPIESCNAISKGKNSETKRKSNSPETETQNQASNFGTPIQKKAKYGLEPKTPEPNFRIVSVVSISEGNDVPNYSKSTDLSMYETVEAKKYFNYLGLDLVPKKKIFQRHDFQNQNNSNSIQQQQPDFQRSQHPQDKEFKAIDNFQSDQDFTRYCTADKDGFLIKVTIDKQNCLPICSKCESKILRKIKKYGRNFGHKLCHHLDKDIAYYEALNQTEIFDFPQKKAPMPKIDELATHNPEPEDPYSPISDAEVHEDDPLKLTTKAKENTYSQRKNEPKKFYQESTSHIPDGMNLVSKEYTNTPSKNGPRKSNQEPKPCVPDDISLVSESYKTAENFPEPIQIYSSEFARLPPPQIKEKDADNTIHGNELPLAQNLKPSHCDTTEDQMHSPFQDVNVDINQPLSRTESETITQVNQARSSNTYQDRPSKTNQTKPATTIHTIPVIAPDLPETKTDFLEKLSTENNNLENRKYENLPHEAVIEDNTLHTGKSNKEDKTFEVALDAPPLENELPRKSKSSTSSMKSESLTMSISLKEKLINIAQVKDDLFLSDEETNHHFPYQGVQHGPKGSCQLQEDLYLSESDTLSQDSVQDRNQSQESTQVQDRNQVQDNVKVQDGHQVQDIVKVQERSKVQDTIHVQDSIKNQVRTHVQDGIQVPASIQVQDCIRAENIIQVQDSTKVQNSIQTQDCTQVQKSTQIQDNAPVQDRSQRQASAEVQDSIQVCKDRHRNNTSLSCEPFEDKGMKQQVPVAAISDERLVTADTTTSRKQNETLKNKSPNQAVTGFMNVKHQTFQSQKEVKVDKGRLLDTIGSKQNVEQADNQAEHASPAVDGKILTRVQEELKRDILAMPEWIKLSQVIKESKDSVSRPDCGLSGTVISAKVNRNEGSEKARRSASQAFRKLKANMLIRKLQRKKAEYLKKKLSKGDKDEELEQFGETVAVQNTVNFNTDIKSKKSVDQASTKAKVLVSLPLKYFDGKLKSNHSAETDKDGRRPDFADDVMNKDMPSEYYNRTQKRSMQAEIQVKDRLSSQNSPNCSTILDKVSDNVTVENIHISISGDLKRPQSEFEKASDDEPEDLGLELTKETRVDGNEEPQYYRKDCTNNADENICQTSSSDENELYDVDPCFLYESVASIFTPEEGSPKHRSKTPEKEKATVEKPKEDSLIDENKGNSEITSRNSDVQNQRNLSGQQKNNAESSLDPKTSNGTEEVQNVLGDLTDTIANVEAETDISKSSKDNIHTEKHPEQKNIETKCYFVNPIYKSMLNQKLLNIRSSEFMKKLNSWSKESALSKEEMILKINKCFSEARKQKKWNQKKLEELRADNEGHNSHIKVAEDQNNEDTQIGQKGGTGIKTDKATPMISESNAKEHHLKASKSTNPSIQKMHRQPASKSDSENGSNPGKKSVEESTISSQNVQGKRINPSVDCSKTNDSGFGTSIKVEKLSPKSTETHQRKRIHDPIVKKHRLQLDKSKGQAAKRIIVKEEPVSPKDQSNMTPQVSHPDQTNKADSPPQLTISNVYSLNQANPKSEVLQEKKLSNIGKSGITSTSTTPFQNGPDQTGPVSNASRIPKCASIDKENGKGALACQNGGQCSQEDKVTSVKAYPRSNFPSINGGAFRPVQRTNSSERYQIQDRNYFQDHSKTNDNNVQSCPIAPPGQTIIQSSKGSAVKRQISTNQFFGITQAPKPSSATLQKLTNPITRGMGTQNQIAPELIRPECIHPQGFTNHPLLRMNYQPTLNPDPRIPSFRPLHLPENTSQMVKMYKQRFSKIPPTNSNLTTVGDQYPVLHSRLASKVSIRDNVPRATHQTLNEVASSTSNSQRLQGQNETTGSAKANIVKEVQIPTMPTSVPQVTLKEQSRQNIRPGKILSSSKTPHESVIRKPKPSSSSYTIHDFENLNPWNCEPNQTVTTKTLANRTPLKSPKVLSKKAYLMKRSTNPGVLSKSAKPIVKKSPLNPNTANSTVQLTKVQKYFQNKLSNLLKASINVTKVTDAKGQPVTPTKLIQGQVPVYIRYERKESGQRKTSVIMGRQNRTSPKDMEFYDLESTQIAFQKFQKINQQKELSGNTQIIKANPVTSTNIESAKTTSDAAKTGYPPKDKDSQSGSVTSESTLSKARKQLLPTQTSTTLLNSKSSTSTIKRESIGTELSADTRRINVKRAPSKKEKKINYDRKSNPQHSENLVGAVMDKTKEDEQATKRKVLQKWIKELSRCNQRSRLSTGHGSKLKFFGKGKDPFNKENNVGTNPGSSNNSVVYSNTSSSTKHGGQILKIRPRSTQSSQSDRATYTIAQRDAIMNAISAYFQQRASGKEKEKNVKVCPSSTSNSSSSTKIGQHTHMSRSNAILTEPPQQPTNHSTTAHVKRTKVVWPVGYGGRKSSSQSDLTRVDHEQPIRRPRKQILTPMADYKGSDYFLTLNTTRTSRPASNISSSEVVTQGMHTLPTLNKVRLEPSECSWASKRKSEELPSSTNDSSKMMRISENAQTLRNIKTIPTEIPKQNSRDPRTVKRRVAPEVSTAEYLKSDNAQQSNQQKTGQDETHQKNNSHLTPRNKCNATVSSSSKVEDDHQQNVIISKADRSFARLLEFSNTRYSMEDVHKSKACANQVEEDRTDKETISVDSGRDLDSLALIDGSNRPDAPNKTVTPSKNEDEGAREAASYKVSQVRSNAFNLKPCSVVIQKDVVYSSELLKDQPISDTNSNQQEMKSVSADEAAEDVAVKEVDEDDDRFDSQSTQILGDSRPLEELQNTSKRKRHQTESFSITTKKNNKLLLRIKLGDYHKKRKRKKHSHSSKNGDSDIQDTYDEENVGDRDSKSHGHSDVYQSDEELWS